MKVTVTTTDDKPRPLPAEPHYKLHATVTVTVDVPDITLEDLVGGEAEEYGLDPDDIAGIVSRMGETAYPSEAQDLLAIFIDYFKPTIEAEVDLERLPLTEGTTP